MTRFMDFVSNRYGTAFSNYFEPYDWSVRNIPDFRAAAWDFLRNIWWLSAGGCGETGSLA
jgi:hypothetical protein